MSLIETLNSDLKDSLKAGDKAKAELIRGLKSDIKYKEIEKKHPLSDDEALAVLNAAAKRRKDSIEQFRNGKREDLAAKETAELEMISHYLPQQLSDDELSKIVAETMSAMGPSMPADLGKIMKEVMPKVKGLADGNRVKQMIAAKLSS